MHPITFCLFYTSLPQDQWVRRQRYTPRPTSVSDAAGRLRVSARCTAMPPAARLPQRGTWWPGAAGCWFLSWRMPLLGNSHTQVIVRSHSLRSNLCNEVWSLCSSYRRQVNWREAKGEEEINIYQSERRRRTIHSLPKESRVSDSPLLLFKKFPSAKHRNRSPFFFFTGSSNIRVCSRWGEEEPG